MRTHDASHRRRKISRLYIPILVVLGGLLVVPISQAQDKKPVVRGYLFYQAAAQGHSQIDARTGVIPALYREFGQQLQIMAIETSDEANYQWWLACKKAYGVTAHPYPPGPMQSLSGVTGE